VITVVVPTIREDCIRRWLTEWEEDLHDVRVIVVEDNPTRTFRVSGVEHYAWEDIDRDLGGDSWVIPRRSSACRSYGFLKALEGPCEIIWTLDDDCYPESGNRGQYVDVYADQLSRGVPDDRWFNTIHGSLLYPRGYPYGIRVAAKPVVVHHGLWSNVPDLDGVTQLANPDFRLAPTSTVGVVPYGRFFPFCIMNVGFRREFTPALYMLLMGKDNNLESWGFDRFDDIWAGLFVKKIADHLGLAVTSGFPGIHHSKASDPHRNVELEAAGVMAHERFWEYISGVRLSGGSVGECYAELAWAVWSSPVPPPAGRGDYWFKLSGAMRIWNRLVEERL
jgi:reversibly glycosylated polypeptide / UDP-arabinopyranose mutase